MLSSMSTARVPFSAALSYSTAVLTAAHAPYLKHSLFLPYWHA